MKIKMKETLSMKICKECDIKPEITQDYEWNDIEIYPDFKVNDNFVKLMSMLHCTSLLQYINFNSFDSLKTCVLQGTLNLLENKTEHATIECLIKFIKNEKWKV